ncbi:MAG TPA: hypothetical protein VHZ07_04580 [Bryobacteraceae bacterium]|jgi:hypothetical protein|nr:hypothetical protein [Bryobacteraceae bacterium]
MALPSEAVVRYLQLLDNEIYRDLAWADEFQETMRRQGLVEAGRLAAPVLRPYILPKSQFVTLARVTERLSAIAEQIYIQALHSGPLLSRLRLLPAERALAGLPSGYSRMSVAAHAEAHFHEDVLQVSGFRSAAAPSLAYVDTLSEIFAQLPILRDLQLSGFSLTPACSGSRLCHVVLKTWKEFGGRTNPNIAVLHCDGATSNQPQLLAELLSRCGADARPVCVENLEYSQGRLRSRDFIVDVVFRDISIRELLLQINLSHPLFDACRHGAVCTVNSFRSDIVNRRSFFALLTDCQIVRNLAASDRKLIHEVVPWTRLVAAGKAEFHGESVDLLEFIRKHREQFALWPNDESAGLPSYNGSEMIPDAWDRALEESLRSVYVVQEKRLTGCESFPVYQYGSLEMQCADVAIHPHIFNGKVHSASSVLARCRFGSRTPLAIAPIMLLDSF